MCSKSVVRSAKRETPTEWEAVLDWSFSADKCFRRCQRQYYFREIMACHNAKKAPVRREAFLLKQVKALELWRGLVVHEAIQHFVIPRWERNERVDWDSVSDEAVGMAVRQFEFSAGRRYREEGLSKSAFPREYCALAIHEAGGVVKPEEIDRIHEEIRASFRNLSAMTELLAHASRRQKYWAEIPLTFKFDDVNIQARVDLLFFRGFGEPTIVEWKTYDGLADSDAHLQTALYAWLLCRSGSWRVTNPSSVERFEVQLLKGEVHRHLPVESDFAELEDRIYQSIDEIRSLCGSHRYDDLDLSEFAFAENPNSCKYCVFRRMCEEGSL
ncbi:PD-(D/E)XK nuclease family protein [Singulisphaera rosea]